MNFLFEVYEAGGFAKTYGTPYVGEKEFLGMRFKVLRRMSVSGYLDDKGFTQLECLPMWDIQLENGDIIAAYPEEICLDERKEAA